MTQFLYKKKISRKIYNDVWTGLLIIKNNDPANP